MKKKLIAILLAATCALTAGLTGCSGNAATSGTDESKTSDAQSTGDSTAKSDVVAGFVYIGKINDGGYTQAHDAGRLAVEAMGVKTFYVEDVPETVADTKEAIQTLIDEGCNLIYTNSFGFMEGTDQMAKEHPNIKFAHCSGYMREDNMSTYFGKVYQARYLAGIVAGMKTESNLIGYVSAMGSENSECTGGIDAFAMGVYSVNPDAKVYVKVTNSWYSPTEETNAAKALLSEGCDVIAQHCDTPNPQLEAESAGKWGVGYNTDMSKDAPKATLTSTLWNWSAYYTYQVKQIVDGNWKCENYYGGMADGLVDIAPLNKDLCTEDMQKAVDEAKAKLEDGSFNVFDGVIETNDGKTVGEEGKTLDDATITGGINWYFKNVEVK